MGNIAKKMDARLEARQVAVSPGAGRRGSKYRIPGSVKKKGK